MKTVTESDHRLGPLYGALWGTPIVVYTGLLAYLADPLGNKVASAILVAGLCMAVAIVLGTMITHMLKALLADASWTRIVLAAFLGLAAAMIVFGAIILPCLGVLAMLTEHRGFQGSPKHWLSLGFWYAYHLALVFPFAFPLAVLNCWDIRRRLSRPPGTR